MLRLLLVRLVQSLPVLLLVSIVGFTILRMAPGDPAVLQAGLDATPESVAAVRKELALDRSLPVQYGIWFKNLLRGDLGVSYSTRQPVTELLAERLPPTVQIGVFALVLIIVIGIPLGIWSALKKDGAADQTIRVVSLFGISVPNFVIGILLILLFGWYFRGVLPYSGFVSIFDDPWGGLKHMFLPGVSLAIAQIGVVARLTRSSMLEVINQEYITAARALGVSRAEIIWKDALRNALIPVLTVLGIITGYLLSGSVVVESVFGIAGLGRLLVESFTMRDYPVTIGVMLLFAFTFILLNLLVDLLYGVVNPRIRAGMA